MPSPEPAAATIEKLEAEVARRKAHVERLEDHYKEHVGILLPRAERAEAEVAQLKEDLFKMIDAEADWRGEKRRAEAEVARLKARLNPTTPREAQALVAHANSIAASVILGDPLKSVAGSTLDPPAEADASSGDDDAKS